MGDTLYYWFLISCTLLSTFAANSWNNWTTILTPQNGFTLFWKDIRHNVAEGKGMFIILVIFGLRITPHRAKSIGILLESDLYIISLISPRKLVCFSLFKLLSRGWHLLPYILSINVSSLQCHLLVYIPQLVVMTIATFISNCNLKQICKRIIW